MSNENNTMKFRERLIQCNNVQLKGSSHFTWNLSAFPEKGTLDNLGTLGSD